MYIYIYIYIYKHWSVDTWRVAGLAEALNKLGLTYCDMIGINEDLSPNSNLDVRSFP